MVKNYELGLLVADALLLLNIFLPSPKQRIVLT